MKTISPCWNLVHPPAHSEYSVILVVGVTIHWSHIITPHDISNILEILILV